MREASCLYFVPEELDRPWGVEGWQSVGEDSGLSILIPLFVC